MGRGKLLESGKFSPHSSKVNFNCCWISTTLFVEVVSLFSAFKNQDSFPGVD